MFKLLYNCTHCEMIARKWSKFFQLCFTCSQTKNFQVYKGRGTRGQNANIHWTIEKAREFQKNIYFCFTDYAKAFDCMDHNKLWKILKAIGIPDYLAYLLRNLCAGQVETVRNWRGTMDWFKIREGVCQDYILSPCLFNLYAAYIMWNPGMDDSQAEIKIAGRNINNLIYADDTTLTAESKEEVRHLLIHGERGEWKSWLKI